jgi:precorrin-2/cobalt-factor-2 C20-methyltransferase
VGTGDPELITVKGLRLLQGSEVVAFPAGIKGKPGVAQGIIKEWLQPQQQQLPLTFPYVQNEQTLQKAWEKAACEVWQYLAQGKNVSFACEGDVSFYSTFTYLAQTLQESHPEVNVQWIPGVCAPMAAATTLGKPLTVRDQRLVVLPALYTVATLESVLSWADQVVLMKVASVYPQVWQLLEQHQLLAQSWIVERATFGDQKIYRDLRDRAHLQLSYFSILVIQVQDR